MRQQNIPGSVRNIVLIGMPGAGKSTVGVLLAKTLGRRFLDTDILIQESTGRLLQEIIDEDGAGAFLAIEEEALLTLHRHRTVIATGGSVVYSHRAMEHFRQQGIFVYLKVSCAEMERRLNNITTRGIVLHPGQGLRELYNERVLLYERYADITVDCTGGNSEDCVGKILDGLILCPAGEHAGCRGPGSS
jgi:shikimate kinase